MQPHKTPTQKSRLISARVDRVSFPGRVAERCEVIRIRPGSVNQRLQSRVRRVGVARVIGASDLGREHGISGDLRRHNVGVDHRKPPTSEGSISALDVTLQDNFSGTTIVGCGKGGWKSLE